MARLFPLKQRPITAVTPGPLIIPNRPGGAVIGPYALTVGFDNVNVYGFDRNAGVGDLQPRASFVPGYQFIQVRANAAVGTDVSFIVFAADGDLTTAVIPPGVAQVRLVYDGGTISPPFTISGTGFLLIDETVGNWFVSQNGQTVGIDVIDATSEVTSDHDLTIQSFGGVAGYNRRDTELNQGDLVPASLAWDAGYAVNAVLGDSNTPQTRVGFGTQGAPTIPAQIAGTNAITLIYDAGASSVLLTWDATAVAYTSADTGFVTWSNANVGTTQPISIVRFN